MLHIVSLRGGTSHHIINDLPVDEYLMETRMDEVCHEHAVVTAFCFNSFTIHLVVGVRLGKQESSISLLVDEQVREINL